MGPMRIVLIQTTTRSNIRGYKKKLHIEKCLKSKKEGLKERKFRNRD